MLTPSRPNSGPPRGHGRVGGPAGPTRPTIVRHAAGRAGLFRPVELLLVAWLSLVGASCGDESTPPPPDPSGACCTDDGCRILSSSECFERGVFLGDGSTCDPPACIPTGACCEVGVCTLVLQEECALPGVYQGDDTVCIPNPCPETGACCLGAECAELTREDCGVQEGDYWGDGTRCVVEPDTTEGPNARGVLLLHYAEGVTGSDAGRSCRIGIDQCDEIVTEAPADAPVLLAVFAAFPPSATPDVGAIRFGIIHGIEITSWFTCAPFEEFTSAWPGSSSGLVATWDASPQTDRFFPVCWFEGYSSEGVFDLVAHPELGPAGFFGGMSPTSFEPAAALGRLGFGTESGRRFCPCR
ncbi:MAG: hypothetical protein R3E97_17735 [Candidatus Eisenbacteria bacterium]